MLLFFTTTTTTTTNVTAITIDFIAGATGAGATSAATSVPLHYIAGTSVLSVVFKVLITNVGSFKEITFLL